jgi:hypothetical protein
LDAQLDPLLFYYKTTKVESGGLKREAPSSPGLEQCALAESENRKGAENPKIDSMGASRAMMMSALSQSERRRENRAH